MGLRNINSYLTLSNEDIHEAPGTAGSASQGHSYVVQPSVARQQEGVWGMAVWGLGEEEGGLADKNNAKKEEGARKTFETVQLVTKDGSGEEDGDHRTGKDDT